MFHATLLQRYLTPLLSMNLEFVCENLVSPTLCVPIGSVIPFLFRFQDQNTDLAMTYGQPTVEAGPPRSAVHPPQQHSVHQTQSAHPSHTVGVQGGLQQQRSFSSSEEERSTPDCPSDEPDESEKGESHARYLLRFIFTPTRCKLEETIVPRCVGNIETQARLFSVRRKVSAERKENNRWHSPRGSAKRLEQDIEHDSVHRR